MAEHQLPKLNTRVRFPSLAPHRREPAPTRVPALTVSARERSVASAQRLFEGALHARVAVGDALGLATDEDAVGVGVLTGGARLAGQTALFFFLDLAGNVGQAFLFGPPFFFTPFSLKLLI